MHSEYIKRMCERTIFQVNISHKTKARIQFKNKETQIPSGIVSTVCGDYIHV